MQRLPRPARPACPAAGPGRPAARSWPPRACTRRNCQAVGPDDGQGRGCVSTPVHALTAMLARGLRFSYVDMVATWMAMMATSSLTGHAEGWVTFETSPRRKRRACAGLPGDGPWRTGRQLGGLHGRSACGLDRQTQCCHNGPAESSCLHRGQVSERMPISPSCIYTRRLSHDTG